MTIRVMSFHAPLDPFRVSVGSTDSSLSPGLRGFTTVHLAAWLLLGLGVLSLVEACAPTARGGNVEWSVAFLCASEGERTERVQLVIAKGDCAAGSPPVYQTAIDREGGGYAGSPSDLGAGSYAFHATALDATGRAIAEACEAVTLPSSKTVKLLLIGNSACKPTAGGDLGSGPGNDDDGGLGGGGLDGGDVWESDAGKTSGPRLQLARTEYLSSERIPVGFADVGKPGTPYLGLYTGVGKLVASYKIPFEREEEVTSGSHEFAALAAGNYYVRLIHDVYRVEDEVLILVVGDKDGDGTRDSADGCPDDAKKLAPGSCGCGKTERDADTDGTPDCLDGCPEDGRKSAPGTCGCGFLESFLDQDNDTFQDCYDACPTDSAKQKPLQCGCGKPDTDSDSDGTADCKDRCVNDPGKVAAGICGCGVADTDSDTDGVANCLDLCPADKSKVTAGACGCGVSDADSDADKTPDCKDSCPADSRKVTAGACGCGVSDADRDADRTPDCLDACPADAGKTQPGVCGCGRADADGDGDTVVDCLDHCPMDPAKVEPLVCGCGRVDSNLNTDGDSALDCNDGCVTDASKTSGGICGCGVADSDADGDAAADCVEACDQDPAKTLPGTCGCGAKEPFDVASFRDADGYACTAWTKYDCKQAVEMWKYTAAEEASLLANCSKSCRVCPL